MKTTIEIPDSLFRQAKIRAAETNKTLKEIVVSALQSYFLESPASTPALRDTEQAPHLQVDEDGFPLLNRSADDDTVVTNEFVDELREELQI